MLTWNYGLKTRSVLAIKGSLQSHNVFALCVFIKLILVNRYLRGINQLILTLKKEIKSCKLAIKNPINPTGMVPISIIHILIHIRVKLQNKSWVIFIVKWR